MAQEPAARPLHELAGLEVHLGLHVDVESTRVERFDVAPQRLLVEDRPRRFVGAHDVGAGRAGLLADPERERRAGPVDQAVHERGRDDLAAQRVRARCRSRKRSRSGGGEVADQLGHEVGVVGQRRTASSSSSSVILAYASSTASSGTVRPSPALRRFGERLVVGEALDVAVEVLLLLERAHEPRVHVFHLRRLRLGVVERAVLAVVVAQHERGDLVGHRCEERVAIVGRAARRRAPRRRAGS